MSQARFWVTAVTALLGLAASGAVAAGPSVTMMADACAVCHGTDGRSTGEIDRLAGMSAREFIEEMGEMATDPHEGRLMSVVARGFTFQEVQALGRYFEALQPRNKKGKKDKSRKEENDD